MQGRRLFIFVEGASDERFINEIVKPLFEKRWSEVGGEVVVIQYSHISTRAMNAEFPRIEAQGDDYLLLKDREEARCVTEEKRHLEKRFPQLAMQNVFVVVKVIEGWYLGGLDAKAARRVKVAVPARTDKLTKQEFNALVPPNFKSSTDFMRDILKYFDIETARRKNTSFDYFARYLLKHYQLDL